MELDLSHLQKSSDVKTRGVVSNASLPELSGELISFKYSCHLGLDNTGIYLFTSLVRDESRNFITREFEDFFSSITLPFNLEASTYDWMVGFDYFDEMLVKYNLTCDLCSRIIRAKPHHK